MVSLILDHGKLQAKAIIEELCPSNAREGMYSRPEVSKAHVNGSLDTSVYSQALHKLVSNAYLAPSTILSHYSPHDKLFQYEMEEKSKIKNFPTAKELIHAKEIAETRLKQELEEAMKTGLTVCLYLRFVHKQEPIDQALETKKYPEWKIDFGEGKSCLLDSFNTLNANLV